MDWLVNPYYILLTTPPEPIHLKFLGKHYPIAIGQLTCSGNVVSTPASVVFSGSEFGSK